MGFVFGCIEVRVDSMGVGVLGMVVRFCVVLVGCRMDVVGGVMVVFMRLVIDVILCSGVLIIMV